MNMAYLHRETRNNMNKLIYLTLISVLSACAFSSRRCQKYFDAAVKKAPYDVIIVPGVPYDDGASWSSIMNIRVSWSDYLFKNGITKNIIYSGSAVYTRYYEAKIMAAYGKAVGIPTEHILTETNAEHSSENVYYSYRIAKENGFKKIALATDPFQAKQLKRMIKKLKLPIDFLPIVFDTLRTFERPEPEISTLGTTKEDFVSIKDRQGFLRRLGGTFGKHIMWHEEDLPNKHLVKKMRRKGRLIEN